MSGANLGQQNAYKILENCYFIRNEETVQAKIFIHPSLSPTTVTPFFDFYCSSGGFIIIISVKKV